MTSSSDNDSTNDFPIVGRDSRANLEKYTVRILGKDVIDYDKVKAEDPALYTEIVSNERESDQKEAEELEEILATPSTPLESVQSSLHVEKPASAKYFYAPVFISNIGQNSKVLTYTDDSGQRSGYASRVLPGQTLEEAIINDLQRDFKYEDRFKIINHYFYDTAPDKHGTPLPRLAVLIEVEQFPTDMLHPAGLLAHWSDGGAKILRNYQFQID